MEDGSVEYMPLYKAFKNNDIRPYGKVKDVSSIVKISKAVAKGDAESRSATAVAINDDGNYYDLYYILSNTEDFKF